MSNILEIFLGAPMWVYLVFVYLIIRGVIALRDRTLEFNKVAIIPILFTSWSIYSLVKRHGFSFSLLGLWSIPFIAGILIGWHVFSRGIQVNNKDMLVHIPGSFYPLILYMAFFIVKYAIGAASSIMPELSSNFIIWGTDLLVSGLISGIFGGRFLNILQKYYHRLQVQ